MLKCERLGCLLIGGLTSDQTPDSGVVAVIDFGHHSSQPIETPIAIRAHRANMKLNLGTGSSRVVTGLGCFVVVLFAPPPPPSTKFFPVARWKRREKLSRLFAIWTEQL